MTNLEEVIKENQSNNRWDFQKIDYIVRNALVTGFAGSTIYELPGAIMGTLLGVYMEYSDIKKIFLRYNY